MSEWKDTDISIAELKGEPADDATNASLRQTADAVWELAKKESHPTAKRLLKDLSTKLHYLASQVHHNDLDDD